MRIFSALKRQAMALAILTAFVAGTGTAVVLAGGGSTWFQTGNYLRQDAYTTDSYAQGASWWDPVNASNIYVWRTYLRMDIIDDQILNCDRNNVSSAGFSDYRLWCNSPFPLTSSNTPAWDYFT